MSLSLFRRPRTTVAGAALAVGLTAAGCIPAGTPGIYGTSGNCGNAPVHNIHVVRQQFLLHQIVVDHAYCWTYIPGTFSPEIKWVSLPSVQTPSTAFGGGIAEQVSLFQGPALTYVSPNDVQYRFGLHQATFHFGWLQQTLYFTVHVHYGSTQLCEDFGARSCSTAYPY